MIPIGLIGFVLFFSNYRIKYFLDPASIKFVILGFSIPSFDFINKIALSIYSYSSFSIIQNTSAPYYFHSLWTIVLILLLLKTLLEVFNKKIPASMYTSTMTGYFLYIILEIIFTSNNIYIFWPIVDSNLDITFKSILGPTIESNFYNFVFLFIAFELFLFFMLSKLLSDLTLDGFFSKDNFLKINRWYQFQKKTILVTIVLGFLIINGFYINKNLLLSIYMLIYILSAIRYLIIIFKLNLGVKAARTN